MNLLRHYSIDFNETTAIATLQAILDMAGVGEGIITFSWFCLSHIMLKVI